MGGGGGGGLGLWVGLAFSCEVSHLEGGFMMLALESTFLALEGWRDESGREEEWALKSSRSCHLAPLYGEDKTEGWASPMGASSWTVSSKKEIPTGFLLLLLGSFYSPQQEGRSATCSLKALAFFEPRGKTHLPSRYERYPARTSMAPLISKARQMSPSLMLYKFSSEAED